MDPRKSKKTRSCGEGSKHARDLSSPGPDLKLNKDRVRSAPVLSPPMKHKQDGRQKHIPHSSPEVCTSRLSGTNFSRPSSSAQSSVDNSSLESEQTSSSRPSTRDDSTVEARRARTSHVQPHSISQPREITVAVLGEPSTGKSTFIQCALDLKRRVTGSSATKKVSLEGEVSTLRLLKIPMGALELSNDCGLTMPLRVGGQDILHIDGALVIYDVMNQISIARIPEILSKCYPIAVPDSLLFNYTAAS